MGAIVVPAYDHSVEGKRRRTPLNAKYQPTRMIGCRSWQAKKYAFNGAVIKPNDFRCRNHHCTGITVLLRGHQAGSADMGPRGTEKVGPSGDGVMAARQLV